MSNATWIKIPLGLENFSQKFQIFIFYLWVKKESHRVSSKNTQALYLLRVISMLGVNQGLSLPAKKFVSTPDD